jgi:hypothetical protein
VTRDIVTPGGRSLVLSIGGRILRLLGDPIAVALLDGCVPLSWALDGLSRDVPPQQSWFGMRRGNGPPPKRYAGQCSASHRRKRDRNNRLVCVQCQTERLRQLNQCRKADRQTQRST